MADTEPREPTNRVTHPWLIGVVAVVLFALAAVVVLVALPRGGSTRQRSTFAVPLSETPGNKEPAVELRVTIEALDVAAGTIRARILAIPGPSLPPEGATLFNSIGAAPTLVVRPNQIDQERSAFLSFESGAVTDYPFDSYRVGIRMICRAGTDTSFTPASDRKILPIGVEGSSSAAGIDVSATTAIDKDHVVEVTFHIQRSLASRGWVLAMMAIYWALAILAACITYLVVRGRRPMETRLLAWLSALVFALIAFRAAAPGAPPVGTFMDYYAVFWSVGIVAGSLIALMILYLIATPERSKG